VGSFIAIAAMSFCAVALRTGQHLMVAAATAGLLGRPLAPPEQPPRLWWLPSGGQALLNLTSSVITCGLGR
jgi:hypothetical protein